ESPGSTITLSGSQPGVTYSLKIDPYNYYIVANQEGNGSSLNWPNQTTAGTYTITAYNYATGCTSVMNGSGIIANAPSSYSVLGGGSLCSEGQTLPIYLEYSNVGVKYQLKRNNVNVGSPLTGNWGQLTWPNLSVGGTYTVVATNSANCSANMSGNATVF